MIHHEALLSENVESSNLPFEMNGVSAACSLMLNFHTIHQNAKKKDNLDKMIALHVEGRKK